MKIVWIVNTIFPYPSEALNLPKQVFGGWLNSLFEELVKTENIQMIIITVSDKIKYTKIENKNVSYYILPTKNKLKLDNNLNKFYQDIIGSFNPDIIHIHGTEYPMALPLLNNIKIKPVVSIQGMLSVYSNYYLIGLKCKEIIRNISLRDVIKFDNIFIQKKKSIKRGKYEKEIITKANNIIGRTSWDYSNTYAISNNIKYYFCNESLRNSFYKKTWNHEEIEKHSIFISQASYPIKGFHLFLEALTILKKDYPDVKVYVAGNNILLSETLKQKLKISGYSKIIKQKINYYNLKKNIIFTGLLSEDQVVERLLKSNVFVQASLIENSPNSLGEAMLLGMPCVASNVGGTSDMLIDKKEGLLYPFTEPAMLAMYISKVFDNDKYALELGKEARKHALITHDREKNAKQMLNIYDQIIKGE
ncbi:MAG: glycosyltransferase family 4 protein [Bacilli bacterium]|nr:glycosyltransferase family 4 protein [Bacilli bacterium]